MNAGILLIPKLVIAKNLMTRLPLEYLINLVAYVTPSMISLPLDNTSIIIDLRLNIYVTHKAECGTITYAIMKRMLAGWPGR
jgi:hypothetical protein